MFNKTRKNVQAKTTPNAEGYQTYELPADRALFLQGIDFKPKNSVYRDVPERLKDLESLIDELSQKGDADFVLACANYLGQKMGRRLSPNIMVSRLAFQHKLDETQQDLVGRVVRNVFTRPDFLAHSLGYFKHLNPSTKSVGDAPNWYKQQLREALMGFEEHTLKNQKMRRRDIKLKDLIKILGPKPKNNKMSLLYKAIIEDGPLCKLKAEVQEDGKVKVTKITTLKSEAGKADSTIKDWQVQKTISDNLETWPINELLKNLHSVDRKDADRVYKRFMEFFKGNGARFINPFDLLLFENANHRNSGIHRYQMYGRGIQPVSTVASEIIEALDNAIVDGFNYKSECKYPLVLFDVSGSMAGDSWTLGIKYMTLLKNILGNQFDFVAFDTDTHDVTKDVRAIINEPPHVFASKLSAILAKWSGGTSIMDSLRKTLMVSKSKGITYDGLIIITDEQTWADHEEIQAYRSVLPQYGLIGKSIVINVAPTKNTVFKPNAEIFRIAGCEGKILDITKLIFNWSQFKKEMISEFKS